MHSVFPTQSANEQRFANALDAYSALNLIMLMSNSNFYHGKSITLLLRTSVFIFPFLCNQLGKQVCFMTNTNFNLYDFHKIIYLYNVS